MATSRLTTESIEGHIQLLKDEVSELSQKINVINNRIRGYEDDIVDNQTDDLIQRMKMDDSPNPKLWIFSSHESKLTELIQDQLGDQYLQLDEDIDETWEIEAYFYDREDKKDLYDDGHFSYNFLSRSYEKLKDSYEHIFLDGISEVTQEDYFKIISEQVDDSGEWCNQWTESDIDYGDWDDTPHIRYKAHHYPIVLIRRQFLLQ